MTYEELWYLKKLSYSYDEIEKGVRIDTIDGFSRLWSYNTSVSMSTRIYGTLFFKKGKIKAIRHVITPQISMSFRPDFTKKKYGYYNEVQINEQGETKIYNDQNKEIGKITSGTFGPSVECSIAMGYVENTYSSVNSKIFLEVRGKKVPANICNLPFYKKNYLTGETNV